jgi:aspartyl-tRNA synthetase
MATGEIEVAASEIELLNKSDPVPVPFHRDAIGDSVRGR